MFFPYMSTLVEVTDLTTHGYSFWRFQLPDALYMLLSRLYRKVNPFTTTTTTLSYHRFAVPTHENIPVTIEIGNEPAPCLGSANDDLALVEHQINGYR
jgi:hypothetical protein